MELITWEEPLYFCEVLEYLARGNAYRSERRNQHESLAAEKVLFIIKKFVEEVGHHAADPRICWIQALTNGNHCQTHGCMTFLMQNDPMMSFRLHAFGQSVLRPKTHFFRQCFSISRSVMGRIRASPFMWLLNCCPLHLSGYLFIVFAISVVVVVFVMFRAPLECVEDAAIVEDVGVVIVGTNVVRIA